MALKFLCTMTSWTLLWDVAQSPAGSSPSAWGQPFQHHTSTSIRPNIRLRWQRNRRILWPATECHWSDTEERHSCCTSRLECKSGQGCFCGPFCNDDTNERGLRLLEFATFNDLVLANTFGHHKASRRWTWHSPNGQQHNQIDYILVRKRFQSRVNISRTWSFAGADHDLFIMTFGLRLDKNQQANTHKTPVSNQTTNFMCLFD